MNSIISFLCLLVFVCVILYEASSAQAQMVGGRESDQDKWPFFAGLFYKLSDEPHLPDCGAVVWDKDTLLTAAHCVSDDDGNPEQVELFAVYMGHNSYTEPRDAKYVFKVREIIMHPHYDFKESPFLYDIALVFLDRSIDFNGINRKVQSVNDPEPLDNLDTSKCVTMGWGIDNTLKRSRNLMEVVLPILNNQKCSKRSVNFKADHHLCAGYVGLTFPTGICSGDSGVPLVCPQKANTKKYSLVGIASFGANPPNCGRKPSYFTNVKRFEDWIASVHSKTRNVKTPAGMAYWADFKKRLFGRLSSYNSGIQPGAILHSGGLVAHKQRHKQHSTAHTESAPLL